jgi:hypothetical protein
LTRRDGKIGECRAGTWCPTAAAHEVVQGNLETLYRAEDDGAVKVALPRFVRKELEGYLACGLL